MNRIMIGAAFFVSASGMVVHAQAPEADGETDAATPDPVAAPREAVAERRESETLRVHPGTIAGVTAAEPSIPLYEMNPTVFVYRCASIDDDAPDQSRRCQGSDDVDCWRRTPRYSQYEVVESSVQITMIEFLPWPDGSEEEKLWRGGDEVIVTNTWCSPTDALARRSREVVSSRLRFVTGPIAVPIKLRPGYGREQFDAESSFGLSYAFGGTAAVNNWISLGFVGAFGVAAVSVRADDGEVRKLGAFSLAVGGTLTLYRANLAILMGIDLLQDRNRAGAGDWRHHGRPWFGIAIGVELFQQDPAPGDN